MAVPKQRHTKGRRNNRRMHLFIDEAGLGVCSKCGKPVRSHVVCQHCGYYKGSEKIDVMKKLTKKERKSKEKEMKAKEKEDAANEANKPMSMEGLSKK